MMPYGIMYITHCILDNRGRMLMKQDRSDLVRVAQVGCGFWGKNLLRVLSQLKGVSVSLVVDQSPDARDYIRSSYPGISVGAELEQALEDSSIDAVVVATPAAEHYDAARRALMVNKHVFVEKPLAMTTEDAQELVDIADARGLTLMAGHIFLYNSAVRRVKELIDSGALGEIYYIYSRRLNLGIVRRDVNVLWNLAPHDVSIIMYWLGAEPVTATAYGGVFLQPGIEDVAFLNLAFTGGAMAHVHLSWLDPHKVRDMTVVGSKKMAVFDDVSSDAKVTIFDMGMDVEQRIGKGSEYDSFGDFQLRRRYGDILVPHVDYPEPLVQEMKHFIHCIRTGERPLTGGDHAVSVVRVLEQAQESLSSNGNLQALQMPGGEMREVAPILSLPHGGREFPSPRGGGSGWGPRR
jgi:predicted dehydrogenase